MRRSLVLVSAALAAGVTPATANDGSIYITNDRIGYVWLGDSAKRVDALWGAKLGWHRLDGGLRRKKAPGMYVYFRGGWKHAIGIVTWNSFYRTLEPGQGGRGVGPCSTVSDVLRFHPDAAPVRESGEVVAYRVGRITFTVTPDGRVGAVQVSTRALPLAAGALDAPVCRDDAG